MLIEESQKIVPTKGKITSEVLKYSNDIKTSYTPFSGYSTQMSKYIRDQGEYSRFLDYVRDDVPDFNPLSVKGEDNLPLIHSGLLEDTKQIYIEKYLDNLKYSFYTRNREGNNIYLRYNGTDVMTFVDSENGKSVLETEDIIDEGLNKITIANMRRRFPALLKSIHDKGKVYGISTLSCARAMLEIGTTNSEYTAAQLLVRNIYLMDTYTGECTKKLATNSGKFQSYFRDWLNGDDKDIAYYDLLDFLFICEKIGINMHNLNPVDYGEAYINSLITDYITPNKELAVRCECLKKDYNRPYNKLITKCVERSIREISLSDYLQGNIKIDMENIISDTANTCDLISRSFIANLSSNKKSLSILRKANGFISASFWDNSILIEHRGKPYEIDISLGIKDKTYNKALLHNSGLLVLITNIKDVLYYLSVEIYYDYVQEYKDKKSTRIVNFFGESVKLEWGEWLKCIL